MEPNVAAVLDACGAGCATLTPLLKGELRALQSGQVLEVVTSDPTAAVDIAAWCNLTGHALVGTRQEVGQERFYIRKL